MASRSDSSSSSSLDEGPILRSWHARLFSYLGMRNDDSHWPTAVRITLQVAAPRSQPSAFVPFRPILLSQYRETHNVIRDLTPHFRDTLA
eukprot:11909597-Alexandrium_andersonii.AAC.1